jgi:hypothetical protein
MPRLPFALPALLLVANLVSATPILTNDFESLGDGWKKNINGKGTVEIVPEGVAGNCLRIETREKALAYLTTMLPLEQIKGKRITVRAKVKMDNVVRGDQVFAEAKLHALIRYEDKRPPRNIATRFRGTADWHGQLMVVEVPDDAISVQLDLGIQNGDGVVWYDNLVVDDGVKNQISVDLENVTNTCRTDISPERGYGGFLDAGDKDLRDFPTGDCTFEDIGFYLLGDGEQYGRSCVVLAGKERPEFPRETLAVAPVKAKAKTLCLLHTASWTKLDSKRPCLLVELTYADGKTHTITVREGVDVGDFTAPADCANWKVAWSGERAGSKLGVGLSQWPLPYPDVPIAHLRFRSPGDGAVPVVLAVSLEPLKKPSAKNNAE